jgi:cytidine deaminase
LTKGPELFIGFVGALGTDLPFVEQELIKLLSGVQYESQRMRITDLLSEYDSSLKEVNQLPYDERVEKLMDAGDSFRQQKKGEALAILSLIKIKQLRGKDNSAKQRTAYIIHSLKHPDEAILFRKLYGEKFILIAAFNSKNERRHSLNQKILRDHKEYDQEKYKNRIEELLTRDEKDAKNKLGQNVRGLFPLADFFVSIDKSDDLSRQLSRILDLLFGKLFITPTADEQSMFLAKTVSMRSSDLSRQVGAVIANDDGEILSTGCNEVPKAGGGAVWDSLDAHTEKDSRDFQIGYDTSVRMKHQILCEILEELKDEGYLKDEWKSSKTEEIAHVLLNKDLTDSRLASLLEFGRIVHAEMFAITDAARRGIAIKNMTLYCTTFPCHMCTRHIIASGIKRVVFIEPYPKSMAYELYDALITIDFSLCDTKSTTDKVLFQPFIGVSPRRYTSLFERGKRKDTETGYIQIWDPVTSLPLVSDFQWNDYREFESELIKTLHRTEKEVVQ